jgi:hypothetical protein
MELEVGSIVGVERGEAAPPMAERTAVENDFCMCAEGSAAGL